MHLARALLNIYRNLLGLPQQITIAWNGLSNKNLFSPSFRGWKLDQDVSLVGSGEGVLLSFYSYLLAMFSKCKEENPLAFLY